MDMVSLLNGKEVDDKQCRKTKNIQNMCDDEKPTVATN